MGDWLRHKVVPFYCVWVLETKGGLNLHLLIHVPDQLQKRFSLRAKRWLVASGGDSCSRVLRTKRIRHSKSRDEFFDYLEKGLFGLLRYVSKGIERNAAGEFAIRPTPQGRIIGKRAGWSETLGRDRRTWPIRRHPKYPKVFIAGQECRKRRLVQLAGYPMGD